MLIQPLTGDSIANRTTSAIPISIGTSLSLESIFKGAQPAYDPDRIIPNIIDIYKYQEIWINVYTLFRNLSSSVSKEVFFSANDNELKDALAYEMEIIDSLFFTEGNGVCKPIYYICNYDDIRNKEKNKLVRLRQDTTDMQKFSRFKLINTIKALVKEDSRIEQLNTTIRPKTRVDSLILTHIPYDLTNYNNFNSLSLLESHTGILKPRNKWYSKYYPVGDKDLSHLPFNKKLLLILGDKILIQPNDIRLRRQIVDISVKRNWTNMTTLDKIYIDIELEIKEPYVLKLLKEL